MSTAAIYEKPTDDLRQVRHEEWAGDHLLVYFTVQRRWLVSVGEPYHSQTGPKNPEHIDITQLPPQRSLVYYIPRYTACREEWRDLPTVRATDLATETLSITK